MDEKLSCDFYVSLKGPKCLDSIRRPSQISHEKDFKAGGRKSLQGRKKERGREGNRAKMQQTNLGEL